MRKILFLVMILLPVGVGAQTVKLINSSSTDWSGGVAGHAGTRYTFTIDCAGFDRTAFTPDTLWIGNDPTRILVKVNDKTAFNTVYKAGKKSIQYTISAAVDRSLHVSPDGPYGTGHKQVTTAMPPMKYKGAALFVYHYKGVKSYFVIDQIITKYPPISYP